jgi:hypothetical protein
MDPEITTGVTVVIRKFTRECSCGQYSAKTAASLGEPSRGPSLKRVLVMKATKNRIGDDAVALANPMAGHRRRAVTTIGNARPQARVRSAAIVQLDNATPTILSLEKSGTRGIRGSVGSSRYTKR